MARINIDDEWYADTRRGKLASLVGCHCKTDGIAQFLADGIAQAGWRLAQRYWGKHQYEPVPMDQWEMSGLDALVTAGLAQVVKAGELMGSTGRVASETGVYVRGTGLHADWLNARSKAGSAGGQASVAARVAKTGSASPLHNKQKLRENTNNSPFGTKQTTNDHERPRTNLAISRSKDEANVRPTPLINGFGKLKHEANAKQNEASYSSSFSTLDNELNRFLKERLGPLAPDQRAPARVDPAAATPPSPCPSATDAPRKKKVFRFTKWDMEAARWLRDSIGLENPEAIRFVPVKLGRWAEVFRLMRERDGLSKKDISGVMYFVFTVDPEPFWRLRIQSPFALRAHWGQVTAHEAEYHEKGGGIRSEQY